MRNEKKVMRDYLLKVQEVQAENFGVLAIDINIGEEGERINITVFEKNYNQIRKETGDYELFGFVIYSFLSKKKNDAELRRFLNCVKKNINRKSWVR